MTGPGRCQHCGGLPPIDEHDREPDTCICCLEDGCGRRAVFKLLADCSEPYCELHGPAMVVRLIAQSEPSGRRIDLVMMEAA